MGGGQDMAVCKKDSGAEVIVPQMVDVPRSAQGYQECTQVAVAWLLLGLGHVAHGT